MSERFIVTGGAGFIGCNLVAALNARGLDNILVVDHMTEAKRANLDGLRYADYMEKAAFRETVLARSQECASTLFHLGACSSTTEMDEAYLADNNVKYSQDMCEWCIETGARFIYASSAATYGDGAHGYNDDDALMDVLEPLNPYGRSKLTFDRWARRQGLLNRIVGLRYFNVYGPHEDHKGEMRSLVHKAYQQIRDEGYMNLFRSHRPDYTDGEQMRDFVYVRDAVNVTLFFHDHPEQNGVFNCGTGGARTWVDLARALFAALSREPDIRYVDMPAVLQPIYQYHTCADVSKLRAAGYDTPPTSIEEGVRDYVVNYLSRQDTR